MKYSEEHISALEEKLLFSDEALDAHQRMFRLSHVFQLEVSNGGLYQFFYNNSGDFTDETLLALEKVGGREVSGILDEAIGLFPSRVVPSDVSERRLALVEIEKEKFLILDERYEKLCEVHELGSVSYAEKYLENDLKEIALPGVMEKADQFFRERKYVAVAEVLTPFDSLLPPTYRKKLEFSRRKAKEDY